jgi:hypothetical protein
VSKATLLIAGWLARNNSTSPKLNSVSGPGSAQLPSHTSEGGPPQSEARRSVADFGIQVYAILEPQNPPNGVEVSAHGPGYRLDGKGRQEAEDVRLNLLESIFDPLFRRRRALVRPGFRWLEIGGDRWRSGSPCDPIFGRKRCGLENIHHEVAADHGVTEEREQEYRAIMAPWGDPSFVFLNALVHACWRQHPAHTTASARS